MPRGIAGNGRDDDGQLICDVLLRTVTLIAVVRPRPNLGIHG